MAAPIGWHSRGYLPHFDDGHAIQAITYRLADSLPAHVLAALDEQTADDSKRRAAIEHYLDAGHGSCALSVCANADIVVRTWMHSNGVEYRLHAWVVMPNHVHVMAEAIDSHAIGDIVGAWKSVSARSILANIDSGRVPQSARSSSVPRKRHFWQVDYHDRFIRNERHYRATVDYIHQNPVKAGLVRRAEEWRWSSAALSRSQTAGAP